MKIITPLQMQALDQAAQEKYNIPAKTLMLNAGRGLHTFLENLVKANSLNKKIAVFAGKGNNAGDAFCLVTLLNERYRIKLFMLFDDNELSPAARIYYENILKYAHRIEVISIKTKEDLRENEAGLEEYDIIIDGLLGTGFKGRVSGILKDTIEFINSLRKIVVSIDIPSGLNGETGLPSPSAVEADYTPTMALPKIGMFVNEGPNYSGEIEAIEIGIPRKEIANVKSRLDFLTQKDISLLFKKRKRESYKGDYGHVLILGGSAGMTGAPLMAAEAALRGGAGLVTIGLPKSLYSIIASKTLEAMSVPLPETDKISISPDAVVELKEMMGRFDVVLIGPGLSTNAKTIDFVHRFVRMCKLPMIIDADGLNALSKDISILKYLANRAVLTPHAGEFSRLTAKTTKEIQKNRFELSAEFARKNRIVLVLKGCNTVVTDGKDNIFVNSTGNPGMATAGMGDALSGLIASFFGQRMSLIDSARAGVFIHGLAGDMAAAEIGETSIIASDVINKLPRSIKSVLQPLP